MGRLFFAMLNTTATNSQEPTGQFVTAEFIAKKYKISTRLVYLKAADGSIPSIRVGAKCIRFSEAAIAAAWEDGQP